MKLFAKFLAAGVLVAGSTFAYAFPVATVPLGGSISMSNNTGFDAQFNPNPTTGGVSITYTDPITKVVTPNGTGAAQTTQGKGDFASLIDGNGVVNLPANILFSSLTAAGTQLFNFMDLGHTYAFYGQSFSEPTSSRFVFNGFLTQDGTIVNSSTQFSLSSSFPEIQPTSFSLATFSPTPEPNSLILLGTGLISAAGFVMRKRRTA